MIGAGDVSLHFEGKNVDFEIVLSPEGFEVFKMQFEDLQDEEAACCMEDICLSAPEVDEYICYWLTYDPHLLSYFFTQVDRWGEVKSFCVFHKCVQKFFEAIDEVLRN